jgi:hypothetical protein
MKKSIILTFIITLFVGNFACNKFDEKLTDPNLPAPETADVDLYLNYVQLAFADLYTNAGQLDNLPGLNENGLELMRMEYMASRTYLDAYSPTSVDNAWRDGYQKIFKNANALIPIARNSSRYIHIGMAQFLKAYTATILVDFFGDIPYAEANAGIDNTNPKVDPGKDVYDSAFQLLDSAIANFNRVTTLTTIPTNDLFYAANAPVTKATSWRRAAKTLKLKLLNQVRLVDNTAKAKIDALLTDGELITTDAQAFVFRFSSKALNPDSRHPKFSAEYTNNGGTDYLGNYFMYVVYEEKGIDLDPRWRYYFFRQIGNTTTLPSSTLECANSPAPPHYPPGVPYCVANFAGFYGRDHGNDRGIPPDGFQRTLWGIYPVGGKFDNDEKAKITGAADGAQGQGIAPIWQPAFTDFVKAEAALTLGTAGNAKTLLESAVRKSIATVVSFPISIGVTVPTNRVPSTAKIQAYVDKVLQLYDAAATTQDKLNVVMKEYYIALYGNGIEAYNNYRRTGMPKNIQPNLNPSPGPFLRSLIYPAVFANRNNLVTQKSTTNVKVFWDNNPDNLFVN